MNEKMLILKMLEEGKITAAEAARLLDSSDGGVVSPQPTTTPQPPPPKPSYSHPAPETRPADAPDRRQVPPRSAHAPSPGPGVVEDFTSDLSRRFEKFARDVEPKLYKFTEAVAEKTANVADRISKSLNYDSSEPGRPANPSPEAPYAKKSFSNMEERMFESYVTPGYNELSLSGLNGDVLIKGYNGDKISARIYYKAKRPGAKIEIMKLGSKYFLNYEEDEFEKVAIDAFVPETMFNSVYIQTINGQLSVSTLKAESCVLSNANAATEIKDLETSDLSVECTNGLLKLENISGNSAKIENFNSNIQAAGVDISNMELIAQNGSVVMNNASYDRHSDYIWAVEASNGKLTLNLPSSRDTGYHIKAHTTLSVIKIGLTGLSYIFNEPSFAEAKSSLYDVSAKKIRLSLESSNAPIVVN